MAGMPSGVFRDLLNGVPGPVGSAPQVSDINQLFSIFSGTAFSKPFCGSIKEILEG
jgi:hypothetical protein